MVFLFYNGAKAIHIPEMVLQNLSSAGSQPNDTWYCSVLRGRESPQSSKIRGANNWSHTEAELLSKDAWQFGVLNAFSISYFQLMKDLGRNNPILSPGAHVCKSTPHLPFQNFGFQKSSSFLTALQYFKALLADVLSFVA